MWRCATSPPARWRKPNGFARWKSCRRACASPRISPTSPSRTSCCASATRSPKQQATDKIHLLFNNAGIGGGGSLFTNTREQWEKTFNICWGGVYLGVRTFLPMLMKADEGHIVNTSSVNGFWASVGMLRSHTAYSAAKFAVKGFTEALINDLRLNAPHIKCSVVMPGHIGTSIMSNSRKIQSGTDSDRLSDNEVALMRTRLGMAGIDTAKMSDEQLQAFAAEQARAFQEDAPTTGGAGRKNHSRRRQGRALAHPGRRRRPSPRRTRAREAGAGLRSRFLPELCRRGRLAAGVSSVSRTRCSVLHAAAQSRDPYQPRCFVWPRLCSAPLSRQGYALRCVRGRRAHPCTTDFAIMQ